MFEARCNLHMVTHQSIFVNQSRTLYGCFVRMMYGCYCHCENLFLRAFALIVLLCVFYGALLFLRKVTGEYESEFKIAFG